jgi:histone-binding protein RBBP4
MADPTTITPELLAEQDRNKVINEEYKIWKKNAPAMYHYLFTKAHKWPFITCQWFPDTKTVADNDYLNDHRFLLGTNTSDQEKEYLYFGHIEVPKEGARKPEFWNAETQEIGSHGQSKKPLSMELTQRVNHEGAVNKARYMPQNPDIIATQGLAGKCFIFDRTKHTNEPKDDSVSAQMVLLGHEDEGFGLDWNSKREGQLATGCQDNTVRIWDIKDGFSRSNSQKFEASRIITTHSSYVNDVQFHPHFENLLVSCSEDKTYSMLDLRKETPINKIELPAPINCLTWHNQPKDEANRYTLLLGGADGKIYFYDARYTKLKHVFETHQEGIVKLQWSPADPNYFASASEDRVICRWNVMDIGAEQEPEDAEDGPPELTFMSSGFVDRITDFDQNQNELDLFLACAEDNQTMFFQPDHRLVYRDFDERMAVDMSDTEE